MELYADGQFITQLSGNVPLDGYFGIYDGNYDPFFWPNTGAYDYDEWELRVTVTPPAAAQGSPQSPANQTVKKKSRRRNPNRIGLTAQQYNAFTISFAVQEEIDDWMAIYFLGGYQGAFQVALNGSLLNEFTDASGVPKLIDAASWTQLKNLLYGPSSQTLLTDFHYFGHGSSGAIGDNTAGQNLTIGNLKGTSLVKTPMTYVGLDGCRTGKGAGFLTAFVGHSKVTPRMTFKEKGWDPRFGWGWKDAKTVGFVTQGTLYDKHFYFVGDYYYYLTDRDPFNGYMLHTYEEAINFGQRPNPHSQFDLNMTRNTEGDSINTVGCAECFFDE